MAHHVLNILKYSESLLKNRRHGTPCPYIFLNKILYTRKLFSKFLITDAMRGIETAIAFLLEFLIFRV